MSGQMQLKHRIHLKQHQAQVKVFALFFILCHVASCQPKYWDSFTNVLGSQKSQQMCRISKQSFPLSDLNSIQTGGGSQKSIFIALTAEHWMNLCAFRTMNIALFTCQRF